MKLVEKSLFSLLAMAIMAIFMTGCVEHRYYREHQRHTPRYYHRHHMPEPRVDINIHN
ncbi:MAG: hypothetical protein ABI813_14675 [Bacteroidota bacterium]